jgi:transcriptional regulator with XRE-family HTH domain
MGAIWLKKRREQLGLNQEQLAARLQVAGFDVTRASISHWEVGRHDPPLDNAEFRKALAQALRISASGLLKMAGYEVTTDMSDNAKQAAEIIDQLPEDQQLLALGILEQILRAGAGR